ncbi:MAG: amino acid--tRNA ligase-related protein, partial [Pseudomonadota bacterium]|nr:amino acid--tRNA ligase-related protein [Pseudomonadota bacterium]
MSNDKQPQDENKLIAVRREKLQELREQEGGAFPNDFRPAHKSQQLKDAYGEESKGALEEKGAVVSVAGRVVAMRGPWIVLQDVAGRIQLYVTKEARPFAKKLDLGDIVGCKGELHKSGKGDLYVNMEDYKLLTKALRPLPDKFHGLADQEMRYRQRYVDLIANPEVRDTFKLRSEIVAFIRSYLNNNDFLEVETPMLQAIPGGASARPFVTH